MWTNTSEILPFTSKAKILEFVTIWCQSGLTADPLRVSPWAEAQTSARRFFFLEAAWEATANTMRLISSSNLWNLLRDERNERHKCRWTFNAELLGSWLILMNSEQILVSLGELNCPSARDHVVNLDLWAAFFPKNVFSVVQLKHIHTGFSGSSLRI